MKWQPPLDSNGIPLQFQGTYKEIEKLENYLCLRSMGFENIASDIQRSRFVSVWKGKVFQKYRTGGGQDIEPIFSIYPFKGTVLFYHNTAKKFKTPMISLQDYNDMLGWLVQRIKRAVREGGFSGGSPF